MIIQAQFKQFKVEVNTHGLKGKSKVEIDYHHVKTQ